MSRSLPLLGLFGSLGVGASAFAGESLPSFADVPKSPSDASPSETPLKQPRGAKREPERKTEHPFERQKDKAKASQSGNDAKLRDLPSPAQRGSE